MNNEELKKKINQIGTMALSSSEYPYQLTEDEKTRRIKELEQRAKHLNSIPGELKIGMNCDRCKNRGYYFIVNHDNLFDVVMVNPCDCADSRRTEKAMRDSGLGTNTSSYTFDTYQADEDWQKHIKKTAQEFTKKDGWFYIGGQSGCGKTHICKAICYELTYKQGRKPIYMTWRTEVASLKGKRNDGLSFDKHLDIFKKADVLYIDDFFKVGKNAEPTEADVNIAIEILWHRYFNDMTTIISSEILCGKLEDVDEALASRILEKAKDFILTVKNDKEKNIRNK